jgi:hypothetical protein
MRTIPGLAWAAVGGPEQQQVADGAKPAGRAQRPPLTESLCFEHEASQDNNTTTSAGLGRRGRLRLHLATPALTGTCKRRTNRCPRQFIRIVRAKCLARRFRAGLSSPSARANRSLIDVVC